MANPEHLAKLEEPSKEWNQWRTNSSVVPDLSEADLRGKNLVGKNLRNADLKCADLGATFLGDADLTNADLRGADLRGSTLNQTILSGASLRETNLQGVDLGVAKRGLQTEQLAGADLTGAILPPELIKLYESLENVANISESARKLFLAVLAASLYSWLTIATTTDVNLITNRASSPLPIVQTSIPIVGFYWVAPLLLLCVYFYFHFYLQKLWEELGSLPAILHDGRPLHTKIDPWLLNDMVRAHLEKLKKGRPLLSYFQSWISLLLAWWVVPITMFLFWGRFLPRQDRTGTTFHVVLLTISVMAALRLYRLAVATLRGADRKPFGWTATMKSYEGYRIVAIGLLVLTLFETLSWGARWGVPPNASLPDARALDEGWLGQGKELAMRVPRLMAFVGYSPFPHLARADISQKKSTWGRRDRDSDAVIGVNLEGASLRFADLSGAFLFGASLHNADLAGADLTGADLSNADLQGSHLAGAHLAGVVLDGSQLTGVDLTEDFMENASLAGADLTDAVLTRIHLMGADLSGAHMSRAYLTGADLSGADLTDADLSESHMIEAKMSGANLHGTDLFGADLSGIVEFSVDDLTYCNLQDVDGLNAGLIKKAPHFDKAFYGYDMLRALGLRDRNKGLRAERRKELDSQKGGPDIVPNAPRSD